MTLYRQMVKITDELRTISLTCCLLGFIMAMVVMLAGDVFDGIVIGLIWYTVALSLAVVRYRVNGILKAYGGMDDETD